MGSARKDTEGTITVWMKVTPDRYELPVEMEDTAKELARLCGVSEMTVFSAVNQVEHGIIKQSRYVRVKIEEKDHDC